MRNGMQGGQSRALTQAAALEERGWAAAVRTDHGSIQATAGGEEGSAPLNLSSRQGEV